MRGGTARRCAPRSSNWCHCPLLEETFRFKQDRNGRTESAPGCVSNNVPGQPQGIGQDETRERATLWIQEASKSEKFVAKKVGTHESRRPDDEATSETEN